MNVNDITKFFRAYGNIRYSNFNVFHQKLYPNEDPAYGYAEEKYIMCRDNPIQYWLSLDDDIRNLVLNWINEILEENSKVSKIPFNRNF